LIATQDGVADRAMGCVDRAASVPPSNVQHAAL